VWKRGFAPLDGAWPRHHTKKPDKPVLDSQGALDQQGDALPASDAS